MLWRRKTPQTRKGFEMTNINLEKMAHMLGERVNTEWAEQNEDKYNEFAELIEAEYDAGNISAHKFNELACTAFYDYFDLKDEEEEE